MQRMSGIRGCHFYPPDFGALYKAAPYPLGAACLAGLARHNSIGDLLEILGKNCVFGPYRVEFVYREMFAVLYNGQEHTNCFP